MVKGCKSILVSSHNNPDPDAIVSALLLKRLLRAEFKKSATLAYSGVIGRAENSALLDYARADLRQHNMLDLAGFDAIALVDTQPGAGNHRFDDSRAVRVVFDHHRLRRRTRSVPFYDVRTHFGATTTLLYRYWQALGIPLTKRYATLMFYALRTETADMGREASRIDREAYTELSATADLRALAEISNAKVDRDYFATVHAGIERTRIYGSLVVTRLDRLPYPDVVAQIAEYFLKLREASYAAAIGVYRNKLLFSLRGDDPAAHLGRVARGVVVGLGSAGGHGATAGGQIDVRGKPRAQIDKIQRSIVERLLIALGQPRQRGVRLLSKSRNRSL